MRSLLPLALTALLATAACGADDPAPAAAPGSRAGDGSYPLTVENCGVQVELPQRPQRVVVLSGGGGSVGEVSTLVALGVQDTVVANAEAIAASDTPGRAEAVQALPDGGLQLNESFLVPREALLSLEPDLVLSTWSGDFDPSNGAATREQLAELGIPSFVTPTNCAYGATEASGEETAAFRDQTVEDSLDLVRAYGELFDVRDRAEEVVAEVEAGLADLEERLGRVEPRTIVQLANFQQIESGPVFVTTRGIFNDVYQRAGVRNAFADVGPDDSLFAQVDPEEVASAPVELLVVRQAAPMPDPAAFAEQVFARFPQWPASKDKAFVVVSDSVYLGPNNDRGVELIARAAHPDAF